MSSDRITKKLHNGFTQFYRGVRQDPNKNQVHSGVDPEIVFHFPEHVKERWTTRKLETMNKDGRHDGSQK